MQKWMIKDDWKEDFELVTARNFIVKRKPMALVWTYSWCVCSCWLFPLYSSSLAGGKHLQRYHKNRGFNISCTCRAIKKVSFQIHFIFFDQKQHLSIYLWPFFKKITLLSSQINRIVVGKTCVISVKIPFLKQKMVLLAWFWLYLST